MPDRRGLGREAEDRAANFLLEKGWTLITRRYTVKGGEIDLIALEGDILVFVEVKMRSRPGTAEAAIDNTKAQRMIAAADAFTETLKEQRAIRFDLIALDPDGIRHLPDFFRG